MSDPTFTWTEDGCLRTPCPSWCWHGCDGTAHSSESVSAHQGRRPFGEELMVCVVQPTHERYPSISLVDSQNEREDSLTADEAEHLANVLLDHVKILRAHAQEATR